LASLTRGPKKLGIAAVGAFGFVFAGWAVIAPLASAAIAPGVISPDGHRKTVQHLEGGIIRTIHVREGEPVAEGDPLITLDDTAARSLDAEIRERFLHVLAMEARLEAERSDASEISFPQLLLRDGSTKLEQVMEGQRELFLSRRASQLGRTKILEARVLQLDEQNAGLDQVIAAEEEQLALIDEEIAASQELLEQGLERKPRSLALRRARADIVAARAANRAKIAENAQAIGETHLQLLAIEEERREAIAGELADIRRVLAELKGQLPPREDILDRTVIRAPIAGTVMNLRATTVGGVIGAGEPLLDIVPDGGPLIIDARVRPTDIERIAPGMSARVVLTAYQQRTIPLIHGRLRSVSADAFTDERSGLAYFLAKVEVASEDLAALSQVRLIPGMPAEVMLLDGERSLLDYLAAPILESRRRSFREN
uniref:HlyD family type I secretion periplasmic adaptor subunit n=1 Tax=Limimaricola soesokkakensis TaxID=1343159 RepID=UPI003518D5E5